MEQSRWIGRIGLSAPHAAHLLRLGADADLWIAPAKVPALTAWAQETEVVERSRDSHSGIPTRNERVGARITLLVVCAVGLMAIDIRKSVQVLPKRSPTDGSVSRSLHPASRTAPGEPGASQPKPETRSMQKQFMGVAALGAALAVADASSAQAVQWRVEDGGNGHWFELVHSPKPAELARSAAGASGGALAVVRSHAQTAFLVQRLFPSSPANSAWIGGFQDFASSDYSEPAGGWMWVDGTPIAGYTNWDPVWTEPNNANTQEDWVEIARHGTWNDASRLLERPFIVEWSADCNNDGIIDYGQCRDGSLPDYDCDNIPDCCETQATCALGRYPLQWCAVEGGNGHWYSLTSKAGTWDEAQLWAHERGGKLASVTSSAEHDFIRTIGKSCWIGARKLPGQPWSWIDGSQWGFTFWCPGEPCCFDNGLYVFVSPAGCWDDHNQTETMRQGVIEWSADCNNDGIVDYGQILQGQLADTNQNGVPDSCETPNCTSADLFRDFNVNGADLGILLAQWGPVNSLTVSDLNSDGAVDGIDLGLLLSFWGPCPG